MKGSKRNRYRRFLCLFLALATAFTMMPGGTLSAAGPQENGTAYTDTDRKDKPDGESVSDQEESADRKEPADGEEQGSRHPGGGTYRVQIPANTLPSQITVPAGSEGEPGQDEEPGQGGNVQKDVSWTFAPGEADGYRLQEVTEENEDSYGVEPGWYYMLETEFTFSIRPRQGEEKYLTADTIENQILAHFYLYDRDGTKRQSPISEESVRVSGNEDGTYTVTVEGLDKYDITSTMQVWYARAEVSDENPLRTADMPKDDWLSVVYDNAASVNYGSVTTQVHQGGTAREQAIQRQPQCAIRTVNFWS